MYIENKISPKPFIKWVGGKTQLLNEIDNTLPSDFRNRKGITYIEPFVGGGAMLFHMLNKYPNIERAVINDINSELVCTYKMVRDDVDSLISELSRIQSEYTRLDTNGRKEYFLSKRDLYNNETKTPLQTASLFIFLNKTCFNGLYRVNSKGFFNVPHGGYTNPNICDTNTLIADSEALRNVEILCGDFNNTAIFSGTDSIYYLDPPYRPITSTSSFNSYAKTSFNDNEQVRLKNFISEISDKGSMFIASNSDPKNSDIEDEFFDHLYNDFNIRRVSANRMVNSKGNSRGPVKEILITNINQ